MTASSEALRWVRGLPPDSLFRNTDVPGPADRRNEILSRLCAGSPAELERVARGLYYKGWRPGVGTINSSMRHLLPALCQIAGPGGGLASWTALNQLGWTRQLPGRYYMSISAAAPPRTAPMSGVVWRCDNLAHRKDLTWGEVTLIEATKTCFASDDTTWDEMLLSIADRSAFWRLPSGLRISPDRLAEAVRYEQPDEQDARLQEMMGPRGEFPPLEVRLAEMVNACRSAGF
jgi:hypothetical protein